MPKTLRDAKLAQRSKVLEQHNGLVFRGTVTTYTDTTHFNISGLPDYGNAYDFPDEFFKDYYAYVVWDAGGAGAAPQGESQQVSAYSSTGGAFTHTAFTTPLAVGDEIVLIHPSINSASILPSLAVPSADSTDNVLERDVIGNKTDTAQTTVGLTSSVMRYLKGAITELNEILDLTRTGGDIAVSSVETNLFIDDAPTKIINGMDIKIDTSNMAAGDTYEFREYYRIESGGGYLEAASTISLTGAQNDPLYMIKFGPYRYGCKVTAQKTAGTDRNFKIEAFVEA